MCFSLFRGAWVVEADIVSSLESLLSQCLRLNVLYSASVTIIRVCEMDKIAWQKPFSSASDFAIKNLKKRHIFLI